MINKKKIIVLIAILIIIVVILIALISGGGKGSKVANTYNKLSESNEYTIEMKNNSNYEITIAKKGEKTCIDMNNESGRVTTLVKDNSTYVISHAQREYRVYNADMAGETVVTDMLRDLKDKKATKGKEKVNGKEYKYEEYEDFAGFMTSTNIDIEETNINTRFYFEGNNLVYIKTIPENSDAELLEVKIEYSAPDEMFEIPSDYAERENQGINEE